MKHGEKTSRWFYAWEYVPNPDFNPHMKRAKVGDPWYFHDIRTQKTIRVQTSRKIYVGATYRFRCGPVPGIHHYRKSIDTKNGQCGGNARGTPWKKAFVGDRIYQREIREEYGITFTMPDKIPHKYGWNSERGWKRSKKSKQWMRGEDARIIPRNEKQEKPSAVYFDEDGFSSFWA